MPDYQRKPADGKASGTTADDLVRASEAHPQHAGKRSLVTGDALETYWQNHGSAACEGKPTSSDCVLTTQARQRYQQDFQTLVTRALMNYKDACINLKVHLLVKPDDDVGKFASFVLGIASAFVVGQLISAVRSMRTGKLSSILAENTWEYIPSDPSIVQRVLGGLTDARIQQFAAAGFEPVKTAASRAMKSEKNADTHTKKANSIDFLTLLHNRCDRSYRDFELFTLVNATDIELLVAWEGMHWEHHTTKQYEVAIQAKLDAYLASGVTKIGRENVPSKRFDGELFHDTRVVYVQRGSDRQLWFQSQDSLGASTPSWNADPRAYARRLTRPVPDEFAEVALARSEAVWGPTSTIHDAEIARALTPSAGANGAAPLPPGSVFARGNGSMSHPSPDQLLPRNSVFAPRGQTVLPWSQQSPAAVNDNPLGPFDPLKP